MPRRCIQLFVAVTLLAILAVGTSFVWAAMHSSLAGATDCFESPFSLSPLSPDHTVFRARLIRVAQTVRVDGVWGGAWAIGVVDESFWGLPPWAPHFVLIINDTFWENTTVLVSGGREKGILTRFLPIVSTRGCGYFSYRMLDAQIYLRLLRKPPASALNRITGYVLSRKSIDSTPQRSQQNTTLIPHDWVPWAKEVYEERFRGNSDKYTPLPGAVVKVTGSSGSWDFVTDRDGIYLTSDLPAGGYTVQILNPPPNQVNHFERVGRYGVSAKGFWTLNLITEWAGTISGNVRDVGGTNANAVMRLRNVDGTPISRDLQHSIQTNNGAFQFGGLPTGGRYLLQLNPYGPSEYSPYPPVYYPAAARREEAKVLEITGTEQHLKNLNFTVKPLVKRTVRVRVIWPNGQPIDDAIFCKAYEVDGDWRYDIYQCGEETDTNGIGRINLFGEAPVRLYAYRFIDEHRTGAPRYTRAVQLEPAKLPQTLDLAVTTPDPPY
jgi:hypothetical protein